MLRWRARGGARDWRRAQCRPRGVRRRRCARRCALASFNLDALDTMAAALTSLGWRGAYSYDSPQVTTARAQLERHNGISGLEVIDPSEPDFAQRAAEIFRRDGFVSAFHPLCLTTRGCLLPVAEGCLAYHDAIAARHQPVCLTQHVRMCALAGCCGSGPQ